MGGGGGVIGEEVLRGGLWLQRRYHRSERGGIGAKRARCPAPLNSLNICLRYWTVTALAYAPDNVVVSRHIGLSFWIACVCAVACAAAGCGSDDTEQTVTTDTAEDTSTDTLTDTTPPPPEGFDRGAPTEVFFTYRDTEQPGQPLPLYRLSTADAADNQTAAQLTTASRGVDCSLGRCWVTANGKVLIYTESTGGRISAIPKGADGVFDSASSTLIATGANQFELVGSRVGFISTNNVQYIDLSSGNVGAPVKFGPVSLTTPDGITYTGGGIGLDANAPSMLIYRANASSVGVFQVDLSTGLEAPLFRLGIPNANIPIGFSSANPVVFSADGQAAVALVEGPMLYDLCTAQTDCAALSPDAQCIFARNRNGDISSNGLCALPQKALLSFRVSSDDLGKPCTSDASCSPEHRCVTDSSALFAETPPTLCAPRALVLGPSIPPNQTCSKIQPGDLALISPKLRLNHLNQILLLSRLDRSCTDLNIHDDTLYSVNFDLSPSSLQPIEGHYGHNAGASFCYDQQEETWSYPDCAIEIDDFELGPNGRGLILKASAPGSDFSGRELWSFDAKDRKYPLTNDTLFDVIHLSTSTPP
jgi:hypothetical protein